MGSGKRTTGGQAKGVVRGGQALRATLAATALACALSGTAPPVAAAVTIGPATLQPASQNVCAAGIDCVYFNASSGAGATYTSPVDGTITTWRLSAGSTGGSVQLRVLRPLGNSGKFTAVGTSTAQTVGGNGVNTFATSLPIKTGDTIALENASSGLYFANLGGTRIVPYFQQPPGPTQPALPDGTMASPNGASPPGYELELNADVMPTTPGGGGGGGGTTPTPTPSGRPPTIQPGFDLFETDPQSTHFTFGGESAIPPGFFDTGSSAFTGDVHFGGVQIGTLGGRDVGDTDTVVRRPQGLSVTPSSPTDTAPIQLVSLNQVSVEPINVNVGGRVQLWDVNAGISLARPSTGQITVNQNGTFSSQLTVLPLLVFTRLSDGKQKTLDVGRAAADNPAFVNDLTLRSDNTPWAPGCILPALDVPGINTGFCPGLNRFGDKIPNVEQALLARHTVYPAQPRLEHFQCYAIRARTRFRPRRVTLTDQFGRTSARVTRPTGLCAPAQKNRERLRNRTGHLKCYAIAERRFRPRLVAVRNQFGPGRLTVLRPTSLCLPSLKYAVRVRRAPSLLRARASLTDHFKCYAVRQVGRVRPRVVVVADQFGRSRVRVLAPDRLCAPVQKNRTRVQHPVRHLVCYPLRRLAPKRFRKRQVRVVNQFGVELVRVLGPQELCVPSLKVLIR
jgi:hypothetical protein